MAFRLSLRRLLYPFIGLLVIIAILIYFRFTGARIVESLPDPCKVPFALSVTFGPSEVACGTEFAIDLVSGYPTVKLVNADKTRLYTVIMVDPDAPSPENPSSRYWVHWIKTGISGEMLQGGVGPSSADAFAFNPPTPAPNGKHRYQFYLFDQPGDAPILGNLRDKFDPKASFGSNIIAANEFKTERETVFS